ncbi:MAG: ATP-binding cassette domain-containing protein [Anaerolineales bacterium]
MPKRDVPFLEAEHLTWETNGVTIVRDISVAIEEESVVAVVGPSGAGKSSFLRLLNRLSEPTGGRVYLQGQDYRDLSPRILRRQLGMVMQLPHLFPGTVAQNLCFGPRQFGEELSPADIHQLLAEVGLENYASRDVSTLSVGEAQRVSLARTLANSPQALLLDEPTSALDEDREREVEALICRIIAEEKLTCLIVTHDTAQARRMADQAMRIVDGTNVDLGPIEEVLDAK